MKLLRTVIACFALAGAASAATQMSTSHEGLYLVRLECREPQPQVCKELEGTHRLTVMNVQVRDHALVHIRPHSQERGVLYSFASTRIDESGDQMEGRWTPGSRIAEIQLDLSNPSSNILGWLRDPKYSQDIRIRGELVKTTHAFFQAADSGPLAVSEVVGSYEGDLDGRKISAVIQTSISDFSLRATLKIGLVTYRFNDGQIDGDKRVLMLWRTEDGDIVEKLVLPFRSEGDKFTSDGMSFYRTGRFGQIRLSKL